MEMRLTRMLAVAGIGLGFGLAGCDSGEAVAAGSGGGEAAFEAAARTGNVVEVKMVTEGARNYFEPQNVTVQPGDVVRFVLVSGVHNASFPSTSNAGAAALPRAVPYLQKPGQTHDLVVDVPAGDYAYQCDPHLALGMVGTINVR